MPTATKKTASKSKARLTKAQRVANFAKLLRKIGACAPARRFCKGKTAKEAWNLSDRDSWMDFLIDCVGGHHCQDYWDLTITPGITAKKLAAKFPIESFAFYKERGL